MIVFYIYPLIFLLSAGDAAARSRLSSPLAASDCDALSCSHQCETVGEFPLCVCPPDMALDTDGKTCKDTPKFLIAMFRGIRLYREDSDEEETVAPVKARCLDYHYGRREVIAYTNYTIMRYPLAKGKMAPPVSMVTRTETAVTSLAVDWVHDVIYYISEQQLELGMTLLDGGELRTLATQNDSSTAGWRNVVVDPYAKKLFWVGSKGVYSSSLEGEDIVANLISWLEPDRIALDTSNQLIYIIGRRGDRSNKFIARANYNGTKAGDDIELSQPSTAEIFGFGIVGNTVYWESNHGGETLFKCDLTRTGYTRRVTPIIVSELNQIVYDMKLYHKDVQKSQK